MKYKHILLVFSVSFFLFSTGFILKILHLPFADLTLIGAWGILFVSLIMLFIKVIFKISTDKKFKDFLNS